MTRKGSCRQLYDEAAPRPQTTNPTPLCQALVVPRTSGKVSHLTASNSLGLAFLANLRRTYIPRRSSRHAPSPMEAPGQRDLVGLRRCHLRAHGPSVLRCFRHAPAETQLFMSGSPLPARHSEAKKKLSPNSVAVQHRGPDKLLSLARAAHLRSAPS